MRQLNEFERAVEEHQRREKAKKRVAHRNREVKIRGNVVGSARELRDYMNNIGINSSQVLIN